jgi:hypothetical protein
MIRLAKKSGRRVVTIAAKDEVALQELFAGGFLFSEATLAILESAPHRKRATKKKKDTSSDDTSGWSDDALSMVVEHAKEGDSSSVALIIHHEGDAGPNTFAGLVAESIPKSLHKVMPTPKPWEEKGQAVKFLLGELRSRDKTMDESLAEQVVGKVGVDLGLLSFEAQKFSMLLDVEGRTDVQARDVVGLMAAFGGEDWEVFKDALAAKNSKQVVRAWNNIRNGPGGDAFPKAVSILTSTIVSWMHAAAFIESGLSPDDAAARMGVNPYRYKIAFLPAATRWGRAPLVSLLRAVTQVGVRKGHINQWVALESTLAMACSNGR